MTENINGTEVEIHFNEQGQEITAEILETIEGELDFGTTEQELLDEDGESIGYWTAL